ncbi:MAG: hypothetical protein AAF490_27635 [Chloroflexota bacterium]
MTFYKHILGLTAVLLLLSWFAIRTQTFYSNDIGLRYLQAQQLIAQNWDSAHIPYPHAEFDESFNYVPYYYGYAIEQSAIYLSISTLFPLLLSYSWALLGLPGLLIPTILGGLLTAIGVYKLVTLSQLKQPWLWFWLSVFGTPIIFYAVQIWDHSLATGFVTLGMAYTAVSLKNQQSRPALWGGLLIALALAQRPETYLFAGVAGIVFAVISAPNWLKIGAFASGGAIGTAASWLFNWYWVGHPLGFPMATRFFGFGAVDSYPVQPYSEVTITPAIKMGRLLLHINARDPLTFTATLLLLLAIILFFFGLRLPNYQKTAVLWAGFGAIAVAFLIWGLESSHQAVTGLLSTLPFLPLSLAFVQPENEGKQSWPIYQFVFFTAVLYVAAMVLIWPAFGGEQWGARYLLHAYPLLLFSAAYGFNHYTETVNQPQGQTLTKVTYGLVAVALLFQLAGLRYLYGKIYDMVPVREAVIELEADVIFTNHPFLPSFMTSVEDKQFFFVDNESDLIKLVNLTYNNGINEIAVLPLESGQLTLPSEIEGIIIEPTGQATYQLKLNE